MKKVKFVPLLSAVALILTTTVYASTMTEDTSVTLQQSSVKKQLKSTAITNREHSVKSLACSPYPYCKREESIEI